MGAIDDSRRANQYEFGAPAKLAATYGVENWKCGVFIRISLVAQGRVRLET